ncbi:hypothetical protein [Vulcanisaeta sp. JCM 14467]|nr:hypothetical protein [Vulcanisaeta sp. JCM 14467]
MRSIEVTTTAAITAAIMSKSLDLETILIRSSEFTDFFYFGYS